MTARPVPVTPPDSLACLWWNFNHPTGDGAMAQIWLANLTGAGRRDPTQTATMQSFNKEFARWTKTGSKAWPSKPRAP